MTPRSVSITLRLGCAAVVVAVLTHDIAHNAVSTRRIVLSALLLLALCALPLPASYQGKHRPDDGRCNACPDRPLRVVCPWRGQHPVVCDHPPERIIRRKYKPYWSSEWREAIPRCGVCGENLYPATANPGWDLDGYA